MLLISIFSTLLLFLPDDDLLGYGSYYLTMAIIIGDGYCIFLQTIGFDFLCVCVCVSYDNFLVI